MADIAIDSESLSPDYDKNSEYKQFSAPHSIAARAVYSNLGEPSTEVVGYIFSVISWEKHILQSYRNGMTEVDVVLRNTCGQAWTFQGSKDGVSVVAAFEICHSF
jgi:hypothetical protein